MLRLAFLSVVLISVVATNNMMSSVVMLTSRDVLNKIESEKVPLFDFSEDMEILVQNSTSLLELEVIFAKYLTMLRDKYLDDYMKRVSLTGLAVDNCRKEKETLVKECRLAMEAALPNNAPAHWSVEVSCISVETQLFNDFSFVL